MSGSTNGEQIRYKVSYSGVIAKVIEELRYQAFLSGKLQKFDAAWQVIMKRLRTDPWGFGELVRPYKNLKMKAHVGSIHPISVRFGIHEELPLVFIAKVIFINSP